MRLIDGDAVMERIEQAYKDMGVDTHGIWNKQLAEILHSADVEDVREFLHSILGAITQSPTIDAASVVRCKECRYWEMRNSPRGWCVVHQGYVSPQYFCADGERKGE